MQGIKKYQEKMFTNFQMSDRIPKENFYRQLKEALDFCFLRELIRDLLYSTKTHLRVCLLKFS